MLVSELWLREWVSPKLNTEELADKLTMAGLEVGSIEAVGELSDKLVVGRIGRDCRTSRCGPLASV